MLIAFTGSVKNGLLVYYIAGLLVTVVQAMFKKNMPPLRSGTWRIFHNVFSLPSLKFVRLTDKRFTFLLLFLPKHSLTFHLRKLLSRCDNLLGWATHSVGRLFSRALTPSYRMLLFLSSHSRQNLLNFGKMILWNIYATTLPCTCLETALLMLLPPLLRMPAANARAFWIRRYNIVHTCLIMVLSPR